MVIKAISPGMALRGFLECTPNLTLVTLKKVLRSHFKEKSATDLYKSLTTLAQLPNKDPQTSLFREPELRQKVVFASKAIDPRNPTFKHEIIQEHFLRALETGLRDEAVRAKLKPYLQQLSIADEELISKLTRVCAEESERENKLGKQRAKTAAVVTEKRGQNNASDQDKTLYQHCFATLNAVQSQLKELLSEVGKLKEKRFDSNQKQTSSEFQKKGM